MHRRNGRLIVSATDLVGFLACGHLTRLERAAAAGLVAKPIRNDPQVELLRRRGGEHEQRYIELLAGERRQVTDLQANRSTDEDARRPYEELAAQTETAMRRGDDVIYQATVFDDGGAVAWAGHPDFLLRVPSVADAQAHGGLGLGGELGRDFHYEVADTKLAHAANAGALIQICTYVEQIERIQGIRPERVQVVTGGAEVGIHGFRTAEMMAYYRRAKAHFEQAIDEAAGGAADFPIARDVSYPDPVEHCQVCRWFVEVCRRQWRDDDALPLIAGISRNQRQVLVANRVETVSAVAELSQPLELANLRLKQRDAMWRVREQARLQVASRSRRPPLYELLEPERDANGDMLPNRGLTALPPPTDHDLFFDIEGDPFAFWEGLDYLFGVWAADEQWRSTWALDRVQEQSAFKALMGYFHSHWQSHPEMHVFHYGAYEPSHLKLLAGRHSACQAELDDLLRAGVFVDLYRVVRQGVRVGTEGYSIKDLEPLYSFDRVVDLRTAGDSIAEFELWLDLWTREGRSDDELLAKIEAYNRDDCMSTRGLRNWLEDLRPEAAAAFGAELPRPPKDPAPAKEPTDWEVRLQATHARLTAGLPTEPGDQSAGQKATWLLASLLDWHRREDRAAWWRFFELLTLSDEELVEEQEPIGRLHYEGVAGETPRGKRIHRYRFAAQEHRVGNRSILHDPRLPPFAEGELGTGVIDKDALTLDIARAPEWDGPHPTSVVPHDYIPIEGLQAALLRIGEWVAEHGIEAPADDHRAVRDLLLRRPPRVPGHRPGQALAVEHEAGSAAARRLAPALDATTLAIQGPPGSGKTYSGARMILALIRDPARADRRVGITGSSHKVVTNLLDEVWQAAREEGIGFEGIQKVDAEDGDERPWETVKDNGRLDRLLADPERNLRVIAGTVWLWAREQLAGAVDTLFVDEAGQVALANVVAAGSAARNIVLLGDPQQLDQVLQGAHPAGAEKSALGHFLGEAETVPSDRGVFLEKTWRMHPAITAYTSELFYEGKLEPIDGLVNQRLEGDDWLAGAGLRWLAVEHEGNTNASVEEADRVFDIWQALVGRQWVDRQGEVRAIRPDDIVIVSPFNAHRLLIQERLGPQARVGTVDKFQGQEAPVSIYTMATSRPEDAPRGLNFLYSLNRLNVATSRAQALAIVLGSPALLGAVPHSPAQLRMVNGLCALVESARHM